VRGRLSIPPRPQTVEFCSAATGNTPGCFKGGGDVGREAFIFLKKKKGGHLLLHQRNSKERRKELKPLRRVKKKGVEAERRLDDEPETVTGLKLFPCCWR
jgi:hypothetical protein